MESRAASGVNGLGQLAGTFEAASDEPSGEMISCLSIPSAVSLSTILGCRTSYI